MPSAAPASHASAVVPDLPVWNRLSVQLALTIALATLVTLAVLVGLVLRTQEQHTLATVIHSTELLSETVRGSTYDDMLADRRDAVYRTMQRIGAQPGVERVRILNKEGRITFSTEPRERGTMVDTRAEACSACHAADRPIVRPQLTSRVRTFRRDDHRVLAMMTPVYNERACSTASCHVHPASQRVLGVVDLSVSLAEIDGQQAALRRTTVLIGTFALLAFAIGIGSAVQRSVIGPLARLRAATQRLAGGELTYQVPACSHGEIGELECSFNDMGHALYAARADRLRLLESLEGQVEHRTAELQRAQEQLLRSEKLSSLGRLAASVAHEINNPLAGILTYSKLLLRGWDRPDVPEALRTSSVRQLQLVQRETERCSAIVRQLLEFARERPLKLGDVAVNQVIEEALVLVGTQARVSNIEIDRSLNASAMVHADFGQLRQAIVNLLINACDAMPNGGRLTISTETSDDALWTVITVGDTGCGIPQAHMAKVLDPFFTTKEKGTGLGLSVVYGIVERHGGALHIASEVGAGTTVTIRLPAVSGTHQDGVPHEHTVSAA